MRGGPGSAATAEECVAKDAASMLGSAFLCFSMMCLFVAKRVFALVLLLLQNALVLLLLQAAPFFASV
jgi:hypothetical protein